MSPRQYRTTRKLTLQDVADLVAEHHPNGVTTSTISKHERGRAFPLPDMIEAWSKATDGKVLYEDWIALRDSTRAAQAHAAPQGAPINA